MDDRTKSEYEAKSNELRAELKRWENDWAQEHSGSKPGRDDIKQNPDIAQKYKKYNQVRDIIAGKVPPPSKEKAPSRKRKDEVTLSETPQKRARYAETPMKNEKHSDDLMNTPAISRKLFSPAPVTSLGPTPQRDGRVLGLFDLMIEKELTPSSKQDRSPATAATPSRTKVAATPRKQIRVLDDGSGSALGRTPMSTSKRQLLNTWMTPLKLKDNNSPGRSPPSASKPQFETPAFLKRSSLPSVDENNPFDAPAPLKLPRKPLVRGLSEIVASLRKVEEEKLDDDLEALREAEAEDPGMPRAAPQANIVKDQQLGTDPTQRVLLGGFDDEGLYDSPVEGEGLDRDGNPLRVFKKKGQKRTTRKVKMRPTKTKRPTPAVLGDGSENDEDVVPETQAGSGPGGQDEDYEFVPPSHTGKDGHKASQKQKEGTVKKAARKVNELAHANFHRLKLRNNGAKGGPGYNSRFRRRR